MVRTENEVYFNECRYCEKSFRDDCGPVYCYSCGDYYASCKKHKCDPKRIKRHESAMEAANKRAENPDLRLPCYHQQLQDGFEMLNPDKED